MKFTGFMALRVLLADESVTIKKVFQLSLKDFGVDVVTVSSGLDVLAVAKKSKFDIVFADIILQKKSGYEICSEIKNDPALKNIPVVLIWSGFMELDQKKFQSCGADDHLEKPFDTAQLRQVIQRLVSKTKSQSMGQYLSFPRLPEFTEKPAPVMPADEPSTVLNFNTSTHTKAKPEIQSTQPKKGAPIETEDEVASWSMDNFEPLRVPTGDTSITEDSDDEFIAVDLQPVTPPPSKAASLKRPIESDDDQENEWVQKTLSKYQMNTSTSDETPEVDYRDPAQNETDNEIELDLNDFGNDADAVPLASAPTTSAPATPPQLSERQLEAIIRAQSKEVIEKVVWQVVPEIATQIIEREIQKLLKERNDIGTR